MTTKKIDIKKTETKKEEIKQEVKKELKANRNFFFAGKNWKTGDVVNLESKDIDFLESKGLLN